MMMSFYVHGREGIRSSSLASTIELAVAGHIADAVQKWHAYQITAEMCVCGKDRFDPVTCGFCFTGKLMFLELKFGASSHGVDYLKTARAVSAYVEQVRPSPTSEYKFYQPSAA